MLLNEFIRLTDKGIEFPKNIVASDLGRKPKRIKVRRVRNPNYLSLEFSDKSNNFMISLTDTTEKILNVLEYWNTGDVEVTE